MPASRRRGTMIGLLVFIGIVAVIAVVAVASPGTLPFTENVKVPGNIGSGSSASVESYIGSAEQLLVDVSVVAEDLNESIKGFPEITESQVTTAEAAVATLTATWDRAQALDAPSGLDSAHRYLMRGMEQYSQAGELTLQAIESKETTPLVEARDLFTKGRTNLLEADRLFSIKKRALGIE